jgi:hypothetical protein
MSRGALVLLLGTLTCFLCVVASFANFSRLLKKGTELPPAHAAVAEVDAGLGGWVAIGDLTMVRGLWASEDSRDMVSIASRRKDLSLDPESLWPQPWRITVTRAGAPAFECGLYEGLHRGEDGAAWRVGYCRKPGMQETSLPVQVRLLHLHGKEYLRLFIEVLGFDEWLYPVE